MKSLQESKLEIEQALLSNLNCKNLIAWNYTWEEFGGPSIAYSLENAIANASKITNFVYIKKCRLVLANFHPGTHDQFIKKLGELIAVEKKFKGEYCPIIQGDAIFLSSVSSYIDRSISISLDYQENLFMRAFKVPFSYRKNLN